MNASPWLHSRAVPAICPKCNAPALLRSHAQSRFEQKRKQVSGKRPWRCHICGWRGWFDETTLQYPASAKKPLPEGIAGTDVPIPDLNLEATSRQFGIPATMKDQDPNGNGSSIEGRSEVQKAHARKKLRESRNTQVGTSKFSVFGIEVGDNSFESTEQVQRPKRDARKESPQNADDANPVPANGAGSQTPDASQASVPGAGASSRTAQAGVSNSTQSLVKALKKKGTIEDDLTGPPLEFSEQSGKPVSVAVSAAFHHEARNKSWSCPKCSEFALYRSRARTIREILKKQFTKKRPYRCHRCGWRGWLTR